jgi:hypothetical protein
MTLSNRKNNLNMAVNWARERRLIGTEKAGHRTPNAAQQDRRSLCKIASSWRVYWGVPEMLYYLEAHDGF